MQQLHLFDHWHIQIIIFFIVFTIITSSVIRQEEDEGDTSTYSIRSKNHVCNAVRTMQLLNLKALHNTRLAVHNHSSCLQNYMHSSSLQFNSPELYAQFFHGQDSIHTSLPHKTPITYSHQLYQLSPDAL
jgi:hypothetical protein